MYEISEDLDIKARLDNITCKVEALALGRGVNSINQAQSETCFICVSLVHTTQMCPSIAGYLEYYTKQATAMNNYGRPHTIQIGKIILISFGGRTIPPQI